ncbi:MAG TPA: hypothetical protein VK358_00120 [Longimicrobium sp.]|nr:hypothetical protein [Longimicrobium sp.]
MRSFLLLLLCLVVPACARGQQAPARDRSTDIAYTTVVDSSSGAKLPRLTDARTPQARAVNRQLDSLSAGLRCLERIVRGMKTEHYSETRTTYAAGDVLSVFIRFGGFCGGAHPINGVNLSVTFDLRTGKPVAFRDLFADYDRDAPAIVRALFPAQTTVADRLSPAQIEHLEDGGNEYCVQFYTAEALAQTYFAYSLSYAGLVAEPELAHVLTPCIEEAVVPYERVRPFAAPGGILDRVIRVRAGASAANR